MMSLGRRRISEAGLRWHGAVQVWETPGHLHREIDKKQSEWPVWAGFVFRFSSGLFYFACNYYVIFYIQPLMPYCFVSFTSSYIQFERCNTRQINGFPCCPAEIRETSVRLGYRFKSNSSIWVLRYHWCRTRTTLGVQCPTTSPHLQGNCRHKPQLKNIQIKSLFQCTHLKPLHKPYL